MLNTGVINSSLAALLASFRHVNTLAIVDGPFPSYPGVQLVDLAVTKGFPTIPQILDQILPLLDLNGLYLASEFSENNDAAVVAEYMGHHRGISTTLIPHTEFKVKVGEAIGIIHTGDTVPYSSVILH